jgi:hypothetical protein
MINVWNGIVVEPEPEFDDYDDFDNWVSEVRKKSKEPKNKAMRAFVEGRYGKGK